MDEGAPPKHRRRPTRTHLVVLAIGLVVTLIAALLLITSGGSGGTAGVGVLEPEVDVRIGGQGFRSARDGDQLAKGDVARTDDSGQAELTWWEGSVTRLDVKTTFEIGDLVDDPGQRVADGKLEVGRVWNRVAKLSNSEERFEVKTHNATAAVRGTAFIVDCRFLPNCTFSVIEGSVLVVTSSGERILLNAGESVTVRRDGSLSGRKTFDIEDLLDDPWVVANLERDNDTRVLADDESNDADAATEAQDEDSEEGDATEDGNQESGDNGGTRPTSFARDVDGPAPGPDPSENDPDDDPDAGNDGNDGNGGPGNGGGGGGGGDRTNQRLTVRLAGDGTGSVTGPGIDCPGDCSQGYPRGTDVALEATPGADSVFDGYGEDCSGQTCELTMNGIRDVRATFSSEPIPSEGAIAYSRYVSGTTEIWVTAPDGSGDHRVTQGADASWAPNGQRLVFQRGDDLFTVAADGSDEVQVTSGAAVDSEPDWSPDGAEIAFDRDGDLFAIGPDGSGLRLITDDVGEFGVSGRSPSWSPDGSEIAFMRGDEAGNEADGTSAIFVIDSDGTEARRVTDGGQGTDHSYPDWSPDGTEITYVGGPQRWNACSTHIEIVRSDGTQARELHDGNCYDFGPSFSPDGNSIVFGSENPADGEAPGILTIVDVDGTNPRRVPGVTGAVSFTDVAWGPAPTPPTASLTVTLAGNGSGTVAGPGIDCPPDCTANYTPGTEVTLTAAPDAGSSFEGFAGACTGNTCQLTMDGSKAVTATFEDDAPPPAGVTQRVSVASDETPANNDSTNTAMSADGRYVAFSSSASNLGPDSNGVTDVFVRDRQSGTTELISLDESGAQFVGSSDGPEISADGRYVAFAVGEFPGGGIFVRDRQSDTTEHVPGTSGSSHPYAIKGQSLVFRSGGLSVLDLESGDIEALPVDGLSPAISANGRFIAFTTTDASEVRVYDRSDDTTETIVAGNAVSFGLTISDDGRLVSFGSNASDLVANDTNGNTDVFVHDRQANTTTRVSVSSAGAGGNDGRSHGSAISGDGSSVAFFSNATNLVAGDTNGVYDTFVHDLGTGTTERMSVSSAGAQGNAHSGGVSVSVLRSSISANGMSVAFDSRATNLVPNDDGKSDIFVRERDGCVPSPPGSLPCTG